VQEVKSVSSIKYWVWLSSLSGVRPATKVRLLLQFGTPEGICFAKESDYREIEGITKGECEALCNKELSGALRILDDCAAKHVEIMTLQDARYPVRLRNIFDPPMVLYIKGRLPALDEEAAIAVAGTRKATPYGLKMARQLGYELTKGGGLVISGLAAGVDSAAARGALLAGGSCIGVLGTAIDVVYPAFNEELFADVSAVGAIISEYPPGSPKQHGTFPARNRILSGLSVGVVIIEAPEKSGALITADRALEQGRDVFVVPGNADSANSAGSNALLQEGARAVVRGWDVLGDYEALFPARIHSGAFAPLPQENCSAPEEKKTAVKPARTARAKPETGKGFLKLRVPRTKKVIDKAGAGEYIDLEQQLKNLTESQLKIVSVMTESAMHVDDIIDLSRLPAAEVLSDLTLLEIQGYVVRETGKRFTLNIKKK
jgi:DNA processing protein